MMRFRFPWALWMMAFTAVMAILVAGCTKSERQPVGIGNPLPQVAIESLQGMPINSRDWIGRTVVLNFWATWCPPCRAEMPALELMSRNLDGKNFLVVGLSLDTDRNLVREFALQHGLTFPLAIDPEGKLAKGVLGLQALPETWIIAPTGRLADVVRGGMDWDSKMMRERVLRVHDPRNRSVSYHESSTGRPELRKD